MVEELSWPMRACYGLNWNGWLTKASMAHPAKFARGLAQQVLRFGLARGYWRKGDTVLDPFGGVGCGGVVAASMGLRWVGVELEEKFWRLALDNFDLHRRLWVAAGDPLPTILNGDSRKLAELVGPALQACVSSPPFSGSEQPCASQTAALKDYHAFTRGNGTKRDGTLTGSTDGQLGAMPPGELVGPALAACVSSPPYANSINQERDGIDWSKTFDGKDHRGVGVGCNGARPEKYGTTPGQLGAMPPGELDAAVSSPPYASSDTKPTSLGNGKPTRADGDGAGRNKGDYYYGTAEGQLGAAQTGTFWSAAAQIIRQTHIVLKPGGMTAWVVKAFVRDGSVNDFPADWSKLLESNGFTVEVLVKACLTEQVTTPDLFDGATARKKSRKSFFRRLYESKHPENSIDYEAVVFARRA